MAVATWKQGSSSDEGLTNISVQTARVGDMDLGRAVKEKVTVTMPESGSSATVRNNIYSKTNFYIKESRRFIPGSTLRTYLYFRFMQWIFLVYCVLVLPMPFAPFYVGWPWALAAGVLGMVWLVIFGQHAHVIRRTIPQVLSQPIFPDSEQQDENAVYEIKLKLSG